MIAATISVWLLVNVLCSCDNSMKMRSQGVIYSVSEYTLFADSLIDYRSGLSVSAMYDTVHADSRIQISTGLPLPDRLYARAVDILTGSAPPCNMIYAYPYAMIAATVAPDSLTGYLSRPDCSDWPLESHRRLEHMLAAYEAAVWTADTIEIAKIAQWPLADLAHTLNMDTLCLVCGTTAAESVDSYYPYWMEARDLFASRSLVVNALYAALHDARSKAGLKSGLDSVSYTNIFATAVNDQMWLPPQGIYSAFLYCDPHPLHSPATDNYGLGLCALWNIADSEMLAKQISCTQPSAYGATRLTPVPDNSAELTDPVANAMRGLASARAGNSISMVAAAAAALRSAALFGFDNSVVDCSTGMPGKNITCDSVSVAAALLMFPLRMMAGINVSPGEMTFSPYMPAALGSSLRIQGLNYAKATLDIIIKGNGNKIQSFAIDNVSHQRPAVPDTLTGRHSIHIVMENTGEHSGHYGDKRQAPLPPEPIVDWTSPRIADITTSGEDEYTGFEIFVNGLPEGQIGNSSYTLTESNRMATVAVVQRNNTAASYSGRPHMFIPPGHRFFYYPDKVAEQKLKHKYRGRKRKAIVPPPSLASGVLSFDIDAPDAGKYLCRIYVAPERGGERPDSCHMAGARLIVRELIVNGNNCGTFVSCVQRSDGKIRCIDPELPPGMSSGNWLSVYLDKGSNKVELIRSTASEPLNPDDCFDSYTTLNAFVFVKQ